MLQPKRPLPQESEDTPFTTPTHVRTHEIALEKIFNDLHEFDQLILPFREKASPSKRRKSPGHDSVKHINFLYYHDKKAESKHLEQALAEFRLQSPSLCSRDEKLNHLLDTLSLGVKSAKRQGTPKSTSRWPPPPLQPQQNRHQEHLVAPSSPTLSVKHAPRDITWPPLPPTLNIPDPPSGGTSANTSVHTSFNTSFWSEPKSSQEPESPATSVDSFYDARDGPNTQKSEFPMSSMHESTFDEIERLERQLARARTLVEESRSDSPITAIFSPTTNQQQPTQQQNMKDEARPDAPLALFSDATANLPAQIPAPAPAPSRASAVAAPVQAPRRHTDPGGLAQLTTTSYAGRRPVNAKERDAEAVLNNVNPKEDPVKADESFIKGAESPVSADQRGVKANPSLDEPKVSPVKGTGSPDIVSESPGKRTLEHVRVKRIPSDGLKSLNSESCFLDAPINLRFEALRVMQDCGLTFGDLDVRWRHPRTFETLHAIAKEAAPAFNEKAKKDYKDCSLSIQVRWTDSKEGPLLIPQVLPPKGEQLNGWQRKFGPERFLFVDVDPLSRPPRRLGLSGQADHIRQRFLEMLGEEQEMLGRKWLQFLAKAKSRRKGGDAESARSGKMEYVFVALSGDSLPVLDLRTVVGWALPFLKNADMTWCKAYARLDLRTSRALPVLQLTPDEILRIDDSYATSDQPDDRFNDPDHIFPEPSGKPKVMNDGCSEVPAWVMRVIGEIFGIDTPTGAQFRCAGGKGMLVRGKYGDDAEDAEVRPTGPLLFLTKSQSKVVPRDEDLDPQLYDYDPHFLSLDIIRVTHPVVPSYLYLDFLPILIDRHVPPDAIVKVALQQAKLETNEFLEAIQDQKLIRRWIYRQNGAMEDRRRDHDISTLAGFPRARTEGGTKMIEAGFEATAFQPLAENVLSIAKAMFNAKLRACRLALSRSVVTQGLADPTGKLEPGEVHLSFSAPFRDARTNRTWSHLEGEVLIARNPSARPSDMQKVRARYIPELGDRHDAWFFSIKGPQPLADMCSGGDYDGDSFWGCWEPSLVRPFKNAPAPFQLPEPQSFGIEVDERKLSEVVRDPTSEEQVRKFVSMGTANRMKPSHLGIVTKTLERLAHQQNSISSQQATVLADLKDLLMDSDKNGRSFSDHAWEQIKRQNGFSRLPNPAYFQYTGGDEDVFESLHYKQPDFNNITDRILFSVIKRTFDKALVSAEQILFEHAQTYDHNLTALYEQLVAEAKNNKTIQAELVHLEHELEKLGKRWRLGMDRHVNAKPHEKRSAWEAAVVDCRKLYLAIRPADETNAAVREWTRQSACEMTIWDRLKASALAKLYHTGKMWFNVAGLELCALKSEAFTQTRTLTKSAYMDLGLRRRKRKRVNGAEVDEDEFDIDEDDDLFEIIDVGVVGAARVN